MTTATFPSAPVDAARAALLDDVATRPGSDDDWVRFSLACDYAASESESGNTVDPNIVRAKLAQADIHPRRYSSFWRRATRKAGFMDPTGWTTNDDKPSGNFGKPLRLYTTRP